LITRGWQIFRDRQSVDRAGTAGLKTTTVICRNDVLGDRGKVGDTQEVAQRCPRRIAVSVGRAAFADDIVNVDSPEVDTPALHISGIWHCRVKLRSGKTMMPPGGTTKRTSGSSSSGSSACRCTRVSRPMCRAAFLQLSAFHLS